MESTKNTQSMTAKEEMEEQNLEQVITLLKKVKVTSSFVEKLEKEPGYLEFQQEVDLKRQELQKSKQAGKEQQIHSVEVKREKLQTEDNQRDDNVPPEFNALHQILKQHKVTTVLCMKKKNHGASIQYKYENCFFDHRYFLKTHGKYVFALSGRKIHMENKFANPLSVVS
jgi:uncharacterized glyoxalase superfamily protein PhnB